MKYKCSFYNICADGQGCHIIYNTLYNTLVRMNDREYKIFTSENDMDPELTEQLVENGLWVNNEIDEQKQYISLAAMLRQANKHDYSLTITTTMQCNARCPYCYESGVAKRTMLPETEEKLYSFIRRLDVHDSIQLTWFGGEPLMNTELIDHVSDLLSERGIKFSSYVITNGSLLNSNIIAKMKNKWNTHDVQITLDGIGDEYDRIKQYTDGKKYFFEILDSVDKLCEAGIFTHVRLNIGRNNIESCVTLSEMLEKKFEKYTDFCYYPAFLAGTGNPLSDDERLDIVRRLISARTTVSKLTVIRRLHSTPKIRPCMINDPCSMAIDVNGDIFECEHFLGNREKSIGSLEQNVTTINRKDLELKEECQNCKFLPKCMGGCSSERNNGDKGCMIDRYLIQAYLKTLSGEL